ncbi:ferredoxin-thioredoxin reductase catalytic domain-containing protein [Nitrosophilus alvini]|uniref:ferredoxin-thioredoxin reductase catalytic domain-containing protein n=1 Tax=Nitrosophilus alvini TaxID=2714855 RepID=UPI00190A4882|nr:ferredoxin-thioredoxin reductase catalytic domain-containing protein [Nitrosophilus alvini]
MSETIKKIDPESREFQEELKKTVIFTDKVIKQFGFAYNPDPEINRSIQFGLTRNKLIYGKRYCPCFFVTGNKEEDRICPCKPALENEIPNEGLCHCGIFCTPEYAEKQKMEEEIEEVVHQHSRGLSKKECEILLEKEQLDGDELEALIEARELNMIDFNLVDVREWMEYRAARIKGTDYLVPTTTFYESVKQIEDQKEKPLIVYCHVGSRSAYCQRVLKDMGFKSVGNLTYGIVSYPGEIERG